MTDRQEPRRRTAVPAFDPSGKCLVLARVRAAMLQRYGTAALDAILLPEWSAATLDPELLRVASVLLWARHVEAAGLPRFVEALAAAVRGGRLLLPIGRAGMALGRYWQQRGERFSAAERRELWSRLFGGPGSTLPADKFEPLFANLVAALSAVARAPRDRSNAHLLARVATAAQGVGGLLSERSAGMAAYAAQDIVDHVQQALRLLRDPELALALGGRGPWMLVRMLGREVLGEDLHPEVHLPLAEAGHAILGWLADHAAAIAAGTVAIAADDPVLAAAERWRSAASSRLPAGREVA
jgi:hypothetical protein